MGLAAFNRMRLRRNEAMLPENLEKNKTDEKPDQPKEVVEEVKEEEAVKKTRRK